MWFDTMKFSFQHRAFYCYLIMTLWIMFLVAAMYKYVGSGEAAASVRRASPQSGARGDTKLKRIRSRHCHPLDEIIRGAEGAPGEASWRLRGVLAVTRHGDRGPLAHVRGGDALPCDAAPASAALRSYTEYVLNASAGGRAPWVQSPGPFHNFPTLPVPSAATSCALGQLTLLGVQQMLATGEILKEAYAQRLGWTDSSKVVSEQTTGEVVAYSTRYRRTYQSALALLYALPPRGAFPARAAALRESHTISFCFRECACPRAARLQRRLSAEARSRLESRPAVSELVARLSRVALESAERPDPDVLRDALLAAVCHRAPLPCTDPPAATRHRIARRGLLNTAASVHRGHDGEVNAGTYSTFGKKNPKTKKADVVSNTNAKRRNDDTLNGERKDIEMMNSPLAGEGSEDDFEDIRKLYVESKNSDIDDVRKLDVASKDIIEDVKIFDVAGKDNEIEETRDAEIDVEIKHKKPLDKIDLDLIESVNTPNNIVNTINLRREEFVPRIYKSRIILNSTHKLDEENNNEFIHNTLVEILPNGNEGRDNYQQKTIAVSNNSERNPDSVRSRNLLDADVDTLNIELDYIDNRRDFNDDNGRKARESIEKMDKAKPPLDFDAQMEKEKLSYYRKKYMENADPNYDDVVLVKKHLDSDFNFNAEKENGDEPDEESYFEATPPGSARRECVRREHLASLFAFVEWNHKQSMQSMNNQKKGALNAYGLIHNIVKNMIRMISESKPKLVYYSGHDKTIQALIAALGLTEFHHHNVFYASRMIFEVYRRADETRGKRKAVAQDFYFRAVLNGVDVTNQLSFCRGWHNVEVGARGGARAHLCPIENIVRFIHDDYFALFNASNFKDACATR